MTWNLTAVDNTDNSACSIFNWPLYDSAIGIVSNRVPDCDEDMYEFAVTVRKTYDIPGTRPIEITAYELSQYARSRSRVIAACLLNRSETFTITSSTAIVCLRFDIHCDIIVNEGGESVKITPGTNNANDAKVPQHPADYYLAGFNST